MRRPKRKSMAGGGEVTLPPPKNDDENLPQSTESRSTVGGDGAFAGFMTAKGGTIRLSEKALEEAKKKFKDIDVSGDILESSGAPNSIFVDWDMPSVGTGSFPGFSTAGGNKVTVSEKALYEARKKLELEESGMNVNLMEPVGAPSSTLVSRDMPSVGTGSFPGFSTAGGKKVAVSEKAMKEARGKFEESGVMNLDMLEPSGILNSSIVGSEMPLVRSGPFPGFSTAGGKKVAVSEKAMKEAMEKLNEMGVNGDMLDCSGAMNSSSIGLGMPSVGTGPFPGFSTAGGKKVAVSEKAMKVAREIFKEIGVNGDTLECSGASNSSSVALDMPSVGAGPFPGFSTAGGKKVAVSEKAMKQAMGKLEEIGANGNVLEFSGALNTSSVGLAMPSVGTGSFPGFSTAGGKKVAVSEKAIKEAMGKLDKMGVNVDVLESSRTLNCSSVGVDMSSMGTGSFPGFSTAAGRKVAVSEKAMKEAMGKLEEFGVNVDVLESSGALNNSSVCLDMRSVGTGSFPGFSTAGGKKVAVSEKSVKEARGKFTDDDSKVEDAQSLTEESAYDKVPFLTSAVSESKNSTVLNESYLLDAEISMEVEESTRILLEDMKESDDDFQWATGEETPRTLGSVKAKGETVATIKLAVVRVYPIVYCADKVYLSEEAYGQRRRMSDLKSEKFREEILPEIEQEIRTRLVASTCESQSQSQSQGEKQDFSKLSRDELENSSGDKLLRYVLSIDDGSAEFCSRLSLRKQRELQNERAKFEEEVSVAVQEELRVRMKAQGIEKQPSSVLKVRVVDVASYTDDDLRSLQGIVSIWKPTEEVVNGLSEGNFYEFSNMKPGMFQPFQEVKLSSTKETRINPVPCSPIENRMTRKLSTIEEVLSDSFQPAFAEFDTVGAVFKIEPYSEKDGQNVQLSDQWQNILKVKFWSSIKDSGVEDVLKIGNIIACCNLQWRMTSSVTKTAFAQEVSTFLINPKLVHLRDSYHELRSAIEGQDDFIPDQKDSSCLNVSNLSLQSAPTTSRKRLSEPRLFQRSSIKRRHSEHESIHDSPKPPSDESTPAIKKPRLSRKFVPPRRLSPNTNLS